MSKARITIENIAHAFNLESCKKLEKVERESSQNSRSTRSHSHSSRTKVGIVKCSQKDSKEASNHYKTELCRNWQFKGKCSYGKKCQFAHGEKELYVREKEAQYKTKECNSFWEKGFCPYGIRCQFKHSHENSQEERLAMKICIEKPKNRLQVFIQFSQN